MKAVQGSAVAGPVSVRVGRRVAVGARGYAQVVKKYVRFVCRGRVYEFDPILRSATQTTSDQRRINNWSVARRAPDNVAGRRIIHHSVH